jgi:hypothetical protein
MSSGSRSLPPRCQAQCSSSGRPLRRPTASLPPCERLQNRRPSRLMHRSEGATALRDMTCACGSATRSGARRTFLVDLDERSLALYRRRGGNANLRVVTDQPAGEHSPSMLDETVREGARRMLAAALPRHARRAHRARGEAHGGPIREPASRAVGVAREAPLVCAVVGHRSLLDRDRHGHEARFSRGLRHGAASVRLTSLLVRSSCLSIDTCGRQRLWRPGRTRSWS